MSRVRHRPRIAGLHVRRWFLALLAVAAAVPITARAQTADEAGDSGGRLATFVGLAADVFPAQAQRIEHALRAIEQGRALRSAGELAALLELFAGENPPEGLEWRLHVSGEGGADHAGGTRADGRVAVGGELALLGKECPIVSAGGQVSVGRAETVGLIQWLDVCPFRGVRFPIEGTELTLRAFPLELHQRFLWRVTPTFGAPLTVINAPYTSASLGFEVIGLELDYADGSRRVGFLGFADEISWLVQDFGENDRLFAARADIWVGRWQMLRPPSSLGDASVDVLVIGIESIKARNGSGVIEISPVRLRGLGWRSLQLDLEAGITGTGSTNTTVSCGHPLCGDDPLVDETIDTTGLPDVDAGFVRGAIRVGTPQRHAGAGYGRALRPTLGVELALEDRLSIWGSGSVGRFGGELRAWGGKTRLWLDQDTEDEATTWGVEGAFDARARPGLHLGLTSQLGRSFYAVAGDEPRPEFGWRLLATATYELTPQ